jgi:hypothetical protein
MVAILHQVVGRYGGRDFSSAMAAVIAGSTILNIIVHQIEALGVCYPSVEWLQRIRNTHLTFPIS